MNRFVTCVLLLLVTISSIVDAGPSSSTWNTFLRAKGHFPLEHELSESLITLSGSQGNSTVHQKVLDELDALLSRSDVLDKFFESYMNSVAASGTKNVSEYRSSLTRQQVFKETLLDIAKQNLAYETGQSGWFAGVTQFTHLSKKEFQQQYASAYEVDDEPEDSLDVEGDHRTKSVLKKPPSTLDWRDSGVVTPIKNQGNCGCCYAFQTAAIMESAYAIQFGQLTSLSEEDIRDCMKHHGEPPDCKGSSATYALEYVQNQGGLPTDEDYPYKVNSEEEMNKIYPCTSDGLDRISNVAKWHIKKIEGNEKEVVERLATYGPVGVSVSADDAWQNYAGGILDAPCGKTNHAVTLVGYTKKAYIIKNSWATTWGEEGYVRLARGDNTSCVAHKIHWIEAMVENY